MALKYSEASNEFLGSTVRDSLALFALMVLECLHGLHINVLAVSRNMQACEDDAGERGYLEGGSSSNGFVSQRSMVSVFDLLIGILGFTETEHFESMRKRLRELKVLEMSQSVDEGLMKEGERGSIEWLFIRVLKKVQTYSGSRCMMR